jgi:signal peptidase II
LPASQPRRRIGVLVGVAVTVLALDIISKVLVVANLSDRAPVRLLGGFLKLRVSRNPGAAFSLGTSMTVVFSAIAVGVIVVILRTSRRIRSLPWAVTLGLLLGGATGNLTDRIFRHPGPFRGYVVDWIQVPHWPVFNLADSAIVCGGALAVLLSARGVRLDGSRVSERAQALPANAAAQDMQDDGDLPAVITRPAGQGEQNPGGDAPGSDAGDSAARGSDSGTGADDHQSRAGQHDQPGARGDSSG